MLNKTYTYLNQFISIDLNALGYFLQYYINLRYRSLAIPPELYQPIMEKLQKLVFYATSCFCVSHGDGSPLAEYMAFVLSSIYLCP